MKIKNLLIYLFVPLALASCQKPHVDPEPVVVIPTFSPVAAQPFSVTEDFENASKSSYDAADVTLPTGSWNLDGALLGTDANDVKSDRQSIRIQGTPSNTKRNGMITMNFSVKNVTYISIKSSLSKFSDRQLPTATVPVPLKGLWELQVSKDNGATYSKIGETVNPTSTELTTTIFRISDTTAQRYRIVNTSELNNANKVRINIDDITFTGFGNPGITVNVPDTAPDDNTGSGTGTPAAARGVNVGTDAPPASGDNSNLLFGNPSNANGALVDNYLLDMGYYVESYSATRGIPNWVSWHLDETNTTNATSRLDNFAAFSGLPNGYYQVQSNSYSNSGFDRGHNCPSADRTSSTNANSSTFLMTNMIPQAPNNNQKTWNDLEQYLRAQITAGSGNEVYIIMGNYGRGGVGSRNANTVNTIDNGRVTVPSNVWKVAVIIPKGNSDLVRTGTRTGVKVIAVNTPNTNSINTDWKQYLTTVREIENAMGNGFNLLSNLPQSVQDAIETQRATGI